MRIVLACAALAAGCGHPSAAGDAAVGTDGRSIDGAVLDAAVLDAPIVSFGAPAYIKASNTGGNDLFGHSVAISADGSTLAVGAFDELSAATGVGGNQLDNSVQGAGAVYVYARTGTTWVQQAYVKASNTGQDDSFGWTLTLSGDGSTLAVGAIGEDSAATGIDGAQSNEAAPGSGAVYLFARSGAAWAQQAYLKASNTGNADFFSEGLALSFDGSTLAVGADGEASLATGIDGNQTNNSAPSAGAVYVFTRSGTAWTQQAYVKASNTQMLDHFGTSVALTADGSLLAVGAPGEASAATGIDGDQADNTARGAGAVYLLARNGATWTQRAYVKASNAGDSDGFGTTVALAADGSTLAVGASGEASAATGIDGNQADDSAFAAGAVYVFARAGTTWAQQAYVKSSNTFAADSFGSAISLSGSGAILAVGAYYEDSAATGLDGNQADHAAGGSGAAYLFVRGGTAWSQAHYVKAPNTGTNDAFGCTVALSADGSTFAVGASGESSAATGIDGDEADNSAIAAGAAYVFQ